MQSEPAQRLIDENISSRAKRLDLSDCGLLHIPESISELTWLEELTIVSQDYFDYERMRQYAANTQENVTTLALLPKGLGKLVNLKKVVIIGMPGRPHSVENIGMLVELVNLQFLYLSFVSYLNTEFLAGCSKLTTLSLSNNNISRITSIARLSNLSVLNLYENQLSDISPLSGLTRLTYLNVSLNQLTDISPVNTLENLATLDFKQNRVADLSPLASLSKLTRLSFDENVVSDLSPVSSLTLLRRIFFDGNQVRDLAPLAKLQNLKKVGCNRNLISDVSALKDLAQLIFLDIGNNEVADIAPVVNIVGLSTLQCPNNQVTDISCLSEMSGLTEFNFASNQVETISPLLKAPALQKFNCLANPVKDCPADVFESGDIKQLRAFFAAKQFDNIHTLSHDLNAPNTAHFNRSLENDTRRDVKLIVLGNSNAGKTNLVNYLETGRFTGTRNSTHGLEVHRWLPDEKRFPALKDIAVSIWDFGGQEYYHGAYRLFLSSNAMYLLLWCVESDANGKSYALLKEDDATQTALTSFELCYWLETVKHYSQQGSESMNMVSITTPVANTARLLAVQNKVDDPEAKKRIAQELHEKYRISDSYHISLKEGSNKANLRQHRTLEHFLSELEFAIKTSADTESLPVKWQMIRTMILRLKNDDSNSNPFSSAIQQDLWISLDDFHKACDTFVSTALTEDEVYTIPRWLERGGVVVYFPGIPKLADRIFLRPDLLAKQIYEVLNETVRNAGGEFSPKQVFANDAELKLIFIELAQHLELIFPHPNKTNYFLAPQYLPEEHPIEDLFKIASYGSWQTGLWVKVPLFFYRKILHGLLLFYASNAAECRYFWKHGIMFVKNELRVLIKGIYPEKEQAEGIILIGIEKDKSLQVQTALQREIFSRILRIINMRDKAGLLDTNEKTDASITAILNLSTESANLLADVQVSYDGVNYVAYTSLLNNAGEPKVEAYNNRVWLYTHYFNAILPVPGQRARKVFLSYSHQNTAWLTRLRVHLAGLRRAKEIESWDDKEILPGDLWDAAIRRNLEEADVYILLLSADFVASDYIWDKELSHAINNFKSRGAVVIPILFEPLDLGGIPNIAPANETDSFKISDFEIIPKNSNGRLQAVSLWQNQEEALAQIAVRIREAIQKS